MMDETSAEKLGSDLGTGSASRWLPWIGPGLAGFVLGFYVVAWCLTTADYSEDDAYNLGVIRRSASHVAKYWLETSVVSSFFEPQTNPSRETWHRGISMYCNVFWQKLIGRGHPALERIPHLAWVSLWLAVAVLLLAAAIHDLSRQSGQPAPVPKIQFGWSALALGTMLTLNSWGFKLLTHAFVDDVPAGLCVLAGVLFLIRRGRTSKLDSAKSDAMMPATAATFGVFCGLGFLMKDFYLLWGPLGAAFVLAVLVIQEFFGETNPKAIRRADRGKEAGRPISRAAHGGLWFRWSLRVGLFCVGFGAMMGLKMGWSYVELGGVMENPARYGANCHFSGPRPIDENFPFFLYGSKAYTSRVAMAGSWSNAIRLALPRACSYLYMALSQLRPWWMLLVPGLGLAFVRFKKLPWRTRALLAFCILSWGAYIAFFLASLGVAFELRYWIVPVTLTVVVGTVAFLEAYRSWDQTRSAAKARRRGGVTLWWVVAGLLLMLHGGLWDPSLFFVKEGRPPIHSPDGMKIAHAVQGDEPRAILIDCWGAHGFYREYPQSRIVAFSSFHLPNLDREKIDRLCNLYGVTCALYPIGDPSIEHLKRMGFSERFRVKDDVILVRAFQPEEGRKP